MGKRICIRVPNWVGDLVMATPTLRCIRETYPEAHIVGVVGYSVREVLRDMPWLDDLVVFDRSESWGISRGAEFVRCIQEIRRWQPDLAFVLPNSFSSALMMRLAGIPHRVGYKRDARGWLLSAALPRPAHPDGSFRPVYMGDYYLNLCEHVGLRVESRKTELPYSPDVDRQVQSILQKVGVNTDRPLALLHMTAGYGPSKLWSEDKFARLATMIRDNFNAEVCGIGDQSAGEVIRRTSNRAQGKIFDLSDCGINLHLLKGLVATSDLLVSTDSGPRHYGVALETPTVCIMGPTHPDYSTSDRPHDHIVRVDVACGPCQQKHCPRDHACMNKIDAEMVFSACNEALRETTQ